MKKIQIILAVLVFLTAAAGCSDDAETTGTPAEWKTVGQAGFSSGTVLFPAMMLDSEDRPWVLFSDAENGYRATVMQYGSSGWQIKGNAGFTSGGIDHPSLVIDGSGTVYAAFGVDSDSNLSTANKLSVMKWSGSGWENAGSQPISEGHATAVSLAVSPVDGTLYAAYSDDHDYDTDINGDTYPRLRVKKLNSGTWEAVGTDDIAGGEAVRPALTVDSGGRLLLAYRDVTNGNRLTVMRYEGSAWSALGGKGFSTGEADYPVPATGSSGAPFVAFSDGDQSQKVTVIKYENQNWVAVGAAGISAGKGEYVQLCISSGDLPWIGYMTDGWIHVKKYTASGWLSVGKDGFGSEFSSDLKLCLTSDNSPVVSFADYTNSSRITVMKF